MAEEKELRCDPDQLAMLKRCSEKRDVSEWNQWRLDNHRDPIWLEGANIKNLNLDGIHLDFANLKGAEFDNVSLNRAHFWQARLQDVSFIMGCLDEAQFYDAQLENAFFYGVSMKRAFFLRSIMPNTTFGFGSRNNSQMIPCDLSEAKFYDASLIGAKFQSCCLISSRFDRADLSGVNYMETDISDAMFDFSIVDYKTSILNPGYDKHTSFLGVNLDAMSLDPSLKMSLLYNIRRSRWVLWSSSGTWWARIFKEIARCIFWLTSNYGMSAWLITVWFFLFSFLFAGIYTFRPTMLDGLEPNECGTFLRACYFSIVTMTTLGFGDIHAAKDSVGGHIALILQVLLGYVMLGALITRLGILFTSGGPAAPKSDIKNVFQTGEDNSVKNSAAE